MNRSERSVGLLAARRPEPMVTVARSVADVLDDHVMFEVDQELLSCQQQPTPPQRSAQLSQIGKGSLPKFTSAEGRAIQESGGFRPWAAAGEPGLKLMGLPGPRVLGTPMAIPRMCDGWSVVDWLTEVSRDVEISLWS
jgi:hypothetical protein